MACGRYHKATRGFFGKVWGGIKKGASWVGNKILKPVAKVALKAAPAIGAAVGSIIPGVGTAAGTALGTAATGIAKATGFI